jgi:hypothetical protein
MNDFPVIFNSVVMIIFGAPESCVSHVKLNHEYKDGLIEHEMIGVDEVRYYWD